ncbi:MAG: hypothetical protein F6K19_05105 [Cyanothece sp. SIO1E1]|nr:hypothetical protein [Cyanothece sp. SIO1E1]
MKGDVQFLKQEDGFILKVRKSCQASIAETWLAQKWGIETAFKFGRSWYSATLPANLPPALEYKLRVRARQ